MSESEEEEIIVPLPPKKKLLGVPLVHDVANAGRWWSIRWIIIGAFCSGAIAAYMLLPADWLPTIPLWIKQALALGAVVSGGAAAVSRVIQQQSLQK